MNGIRIHFKRLAFTSPCVRLAVWLVILMAALGNQAGSALGGELFLTRWIKQKLERPVGPGFAPSNVYRSEGGLPADLRRVAVLPLVIPADTQQFSSGQEALQPILERELSKRMAFEVVTVSPELLRRWTGKSRWRADEILPEELLSKIREHYACQGVIFAQLTQFHSYGPMEIGWKMQLVDSRRAEVFWAVDEVFNAGNAGVANAARRHAQDHQDEAYATADSQLVLQSPRRFGQFTLSSIFATLPSR